MKEEKKSASLVQWLSLPDHLSKRACQELLVPLISFTWTPGVHIEWPQDRQGHRYFLTILDDHTRVMWVYLMRTKDEAFQAITDFIHLASTQYNKKVKKIRTDNAGEYDDKQCKPLFQSLGIVHETSCADTPQKNGRVERRHRNLLEMARAIRFQSGLPAQYWGECIMTVVHITNLLPTPVLNNVTPYEVLHSTKPKYSNLKAFGCLVIARNPSRNHDKFHPRGVPCAFIGYPQKQKGYKLLNLLDNTVFVSRDTKFYEYIYPYQVFNSKTAKQTPLQLNLDDVQPADYCEPPATTPPPENSPSSQLTTPPPPATSASPAL